MGKIEVWVTPTPVTTSDEREDHFWPRRQKATTDRDVGAPIELIELEGEEIRAKISAFISEFEDLFVEPLPEAKFVLDEIELALAVSASAGVQLIAKAEAGAEVGIRVKLKRRES